MTLSNEEIKEVLKNTNLTEERKKMESKLLKMKVLELLDQLGCDLESLLIEHDGDIYKALVQAGYEKEAKLFSLNNEELNSKYK